MEIPTARTEDTHDARSAPWLCLRAALPGDTQCHALKARSTFRFGRAPSNDFVLALPSVSAEHFEIYRQGPILALRDRNSTNGTFLNGERVVHGVLGSGCVVRAGDWLGVVETQDDDSAYAPFGDLGFGTLGGSALARSFALARRVAQSSLPIALVGETGTGKERFARAIHEFSERPGAFHAINCGALPASLAEGELFGFRRGAFTGADREHLGQLRAADRGTLFLDEIADLELTLQVKLLRALETGEATPLGEVRSYKFDARVVTAGPTALAELVKAGKFRRDLAARLSGLTLTLPPLRERRADIASLFFHFLREHSGGLPPHVTTKAYEALTRYAWPGNVRELELLARRTLALHGLEPTLHRKHLPDHITLDAQAAKSNASAAPKPTRRDYDLERLTSALGKCGGNIKRAAELVGISRQRAYRLVRSEKSLLGVEGKPRMDDPGRQ